MSQDNLPGPDIEVKEPPEHLLEQPGGSRPGVAPEASAHARLTIAERAYVRAMVALREGKYSDAERQLSGFLKLTGSANIEAAITQAVLSLHLAIGEEIAIMESATD
ncbi:MAG: hypothetical protein ACE5GA_00665 [Candidatus Zixiibacteriota bacterium]